YTEAGYFLTRGDCRRYNRQLGVWDRTLPNQNAYVVRGTDGPEVGRGAVQLLARFSYLDLQSGTPTVTASSGDRAGVENDVTLGVNCYLNPQSVIMVDFVRTNINSVVPGASGAFSGLGLRAHFDF